MTTPYQPDATNENRPADLATDHASRCYVCSQPLPPDSPQVRDERARAAVFRAWKQSEYAWRSECFGFLGLTDFVDRAINAVREADAETARIIAAGNEAGHP